MSQRLEVEIWTDIACPWCYIGKTNFEQALETFAHRDAVKVNFKAFQIDPNSAIETGRNLDEQLSVLHQMPLDEARRRNAQLEEAAKASGLNYDMRHAIGTNSLDGLRLVYAAREAGLDNAMIKRLMKAYLEEGLHIGHQDVLKKLALEVGLDELSIDETLSSDLYKKEIAADRIQAEKIGINGVPFFIFNGKYAVSGAQPLENFSQILDQVWEEEYGKTNSLD